jgi:signal transduction histidine kinase
MQFSTIMDKSPENREMLERASRMLEQASGDVRKISHNMMPGLLTKLGLYEAVEDLFEQIDENTALKAICEISGDHDERLPENKEIMLYRIVQELTNNTLKHAQAENIALRVSVVPGSMEMVYTDDGKGFDYDKKLENESLGLKSIQSRVNFLNGFLTVDSKPGQGVRYTFEIPF